MYYIKDVQDYFIDKLDEVIDGFDSEEFDGKEISVPHFVREYLLADNIANNTIPYDAEKAREWIMANFSDLGNWFDCQEEEGNLQNPFSEPELFQLQVHIDSFISLIYELGFKGIDSMDSIKTLREKAEAL